MLSTTPLLNYGMIRAPAPIASLAVWPVVNGQLFILRSFGYSLQEAIVALLSGPAAERTLRRFTVVLGVGSTVLLLGVAFTPVGPWWQRQIAGLSDELTGVAVPALRYAALLPLLAVIPSWLRGVIVTRRATGAVAQATGVNLVVLLAVLLTGAKGGWLPGASLAAVALTASQGVECAWLWRAAHGRRRQEAASLEARSGVG
jgi:hypothetical protein